MESYTRIQMAPEIDSISDDLEHVGSRLPYPFVVDGKGFVQFQDFWKGMVHKVIGFQNHPAVQTINLWWSDVKDPADIVGKYLVTSDIDGNWGTFPTAIVEATSVEPVPYVPRLLTDIAREIQRDWGEKMYFGAVPYVEAMLSLRTVEDKYGDDRAKDIVNYFLANARTWRGETARRVKAELRKMVA